MTRLICTTILSCVSLLLWQDNSATAQVFNNSRQRASSGGNRKTVTGAISTGRAALPPGGRVIAPGVIRYSRSKKPVYSNSRYGTINRGPSSNNFTNRTYSNYRGPVQYSQPGYADHHHHHGHNHGYRGNLHPYDAARGYAGLPLQYSVPPFRTAPWSTGWGAGIGYPTILAPPIVVPYGRPSVATYGTYGTFGPTLDQSVFPNVAPPSPAQLTPPPFLPPTLPLPEAVVPPNAIPRNHNGEPFSEVLPVDQQPVKNEFPTERVVAEDVGAVDRIRSLRYQTTGDNSFVRGDYAAASTFYATAAETAPGRQAPWLRLAWANITERRFADAAVNLKKALLLQDDPTRSWVTGQNLYGKHFALNSAEHDEDLWRWLEQRPNSTDRLLLTAAFQKLRARDSVAKELLDAAIRQGLDQSLVEAMTQVSTVADEARQRERKPLPPADVGRVTPAKATVHEDGIHLRGREEIEPEAESSDGVGLPQPLEEADQSAFDLTIP